MEISFCLLSGTKVISQDVLKNNPNRNIEQPEVVDLVVAEYKKRTGRVFRDSGRAIRKLSQKGQLIKIKNGVYKYDQIFPAKFLFFFVQKIRKHLGSRHQRVRTISRGFLWNKIKKCF